MTFNTLSVETRNAILEEVADSILEEWGSEPIKTLDTLNYSIDKTLTDLDLVDLRKRYRALKKKHDIILEWDEYLK